MGLRWLIPTHFPLPIGFDHLLSGTVLNPKGDSIFVLHRFQGETTEKYKTVYGQFSGSAQFATYYSCAQNSRECKQPADKKTILYGWHKVVFLYASGARNYF
jgi:hypothetical protein